MTDSAKTETLTPALKRRFQLDLDRQSVLICLSLLCYSFWVHFTFNAYSNIVIGNPSSLTTSFNASTYANGIVLLAFAFLYKRIGTHLFDSGVVVAAIFLSGLGTFVAMTSGLLLETSVLVDFVAGIMSGVGSAIILFMLAQLAVAHLKCVPFLPVAFIGALVIAIPLTYLSAPLLLALDIISAAGSAALAMYAFRSCHIEEPRLVSEIDFKPITPLLIRGGAMMFMFYLIISLTNLFAQNNEATANILSTLVVALVMLVIFCISSTLNKENAGVAINRACFLCVMVYLASMPFFEDFSITYGIAGVLSTVSRAFVFVVECRICARTGISPLLVFGIGEAAKKLPGLIVRLATSGLGLGFFSNVDAYMKVSVISMLLICFFYIMVFTEHDMGLLFASDDIMGQGHKREFRRQKVADAHGLTERETEIFLLLCDGRSAPRIAQDLFISQSTVNVHIKNIYKKLDIHSRQELLDLVRD